MLFNIQLHNCMEVDILSGGDIFQWAVRIPEKASLELGEKVYNDSRTTNTGATATRTWQIHIPLMMVHVNS